MVVGGRQGEGVRPALGERRPIRRRAGGEGDCQGPLGRRVFGGGAADEGAAGEGLRKLEGRRRQGDSGRLVRALVPVLPGDGAGVRGARRAVRQPPARARRGLPRRRGRAPAVRRVGAGTGDLPDRRDAAARLEEGCQVRQRGEGRGVAGDVPEGARDDVGVKEL